MHIAFEPATNSEEAACTNRNQSNFLGQQRDLDAHTVAALNSSGFARGPLPLINSATSLLPVKRAQEWFAYKDGRVPEAHIRALRELLGPRVYPLFASA